MTDDERVQEYLDRPYHFGMVRDDSDGTPGWVIWVEELPGCASQGDTQEEALEMIREAMRGWIEVALEFGDPIPEPAEESSYSGRFQVRLPASLHERLAAEAEREHVSLNQLVSSALAGAVGWRKAGEPHESDAKTRKAS